MSQRIHHSLIITLWYSMSQTAFSLIITLWYSCHREQSVSLSQYDIQCHRQQSQSHYHIMIFNVTENNHSLIITIWYSISQRAISLSHYDIHVTENSSCFWFYIIMLIFASWNYIMLCYHNIISSKSGINES